MFMMKKCEQCYMNVYSPRQEPPQRQYIVAQKLLDHCRIQGAIEQGPMVSDEQCSCILIDQARSGPGWSRLIVPGNAIHLPTLAKQIKYVEDSFTTKSIKVLEITRVQTESKVHTAWNVKIELTFRAQLQFLDEDGTPFEIVSSSGVEPSFVKDNLCCASSVIMEKNLYSPLWSESIIASDLFSQEDYQYHNSPHVLVEAHARSMGFRAFCPYAEGCFDVYDDIYSEPVQYLYASIDMYADIRLFRYCNMLVNGTVCNAPRTKHSCLESISQAIKKSSFPFPFLPKQGR
jgi:hypothetical protein